MKHYSTFTILLVALVSGCTETDCHQSRTCPGQTAVGEGDASTDADTADGGASSASEGESEDGGIDGGELGTDTGTTPNGGACEADMRRECWQDELGNPLPELEGELMGSCRRGTQTCMASGEWGPCQGAIEPEQEDRCDVAGADDDCNGVANEGCTCTGSETRDCGTAVGNCKLGTQTCNGTTWGDCEGGVEAVGRDSCAIAGDDADCNGKPNEDCECTADSPEDCDDGVSCTADVCNDGQCQHTIESGFCLIAGTCRDHNANDPANACRYCDTGTSQTSWTNWSSTKSCSDGNWCNGGETCDGKGKCVSEGPRCPAPSEGPCVLDTCDEENQRCFRTSAAVCDEYEESRCSAADTCGATIQTRQIARYCDGASAGCIGAFDRDSWEEALCPSDQVCSGGGSLECVEDTTLCPFWCDPTTTLCWQTTPALPGRVSGTEGAAACADGTWGGFTNWRLPTIGEWIGVIRGCGPGGVPTGSTSTPYDCQSSCTGSTCSTNCPSCPTGQGPDAQDGCYLRQELGLPCELYLTSNQSGSGFDYTVLGNSALITAEDDEAYVRCVRND